MNNLDWKIAEAKYKRWRLNKQQDLSPAQELREWGIPTSLSRGLSRIGFNRTQNRLNEIKRLTERTEKLESKKAAMRAHLKEIQDFTRYKIGPYTNREQIDGGKYRPNWRYPSMTRMYDDEPPAAAKPGEWSEKLKKIYWKQTLQRPFRELMLWYTGAKPGGFPFGIEKEEKKADHRPLQPDAKVYEPFKDSKKD